MAAPEGDATHYAQAKIARTPTREVDDAYGDSARARLA